MKKITEAGEDARFMAWMELYASRGEGAKGEIQKIVGGEDPVVKILFCRFLGNMGEERAIHYLLELLQDKNEIVVEQAKKNFEKNRFGLKFKKLVPLIHSEQPSARHFAIEKTAAAGLWEVVNPLLKMLPGAEEELLLRILVAFRFLPDKKIIPAIAGYLRDNREEVRFKTVLAFGSLYEAGFSSVRKYLVAALGDHVARIRQGVLWSLRKSPSRKDLKLLFSLSREDVDPGVRQEALLELGFLPSAAVTGHLLNVLVFDRNKMVTLKAEAVLLSLSEKPLIRGLKKALRMKNPAIRNEALLLISDFQKGCARKGSARKGPAAFFKYIAAELEKARSEKEKLPLLEALGGLEAQESLPLLEGYLHAPPVLAYGAMNSLLKVIRKGDIRRVFGYLEDPGLSPLLKQIVLKHLMHSCTREMFDRKVLEILIPLLNNPNLNIRYLTARTLVLSESEEVVESLLRAFLGEADLQVIGFLQEGVVKLCADRPFLFLTMLQKHRDEKITFHLLLSILKRIRFSGAQVLGLIEPLFGEPERLLLSEYRLLGADFLFSCLLEKKVTLEALLEKMERVPGREHFLSFLAGELEKRSAYLLPIPVEKLGEWIDPSNALQTEAVISLLGLSRSEKAILPLVSVACDAAMGRYHSGAALALKTLMRIAA